MGCLKDLEWEFQKWGEPAGNCIYWGPSGGKPKPEKVNLNLFDQMNEAINLWLASMFTHPNKRVDDGCKG